MIKLKNLLIEAPKIKKVKNVSVQYVDAEYQGETLHGFRYFKKGPWLYKRDNGEYFAIVITNKDNRYEIQLGKQKNNIQATAAVEKIIKRNLNKFESIDEGKLKLTKDKPKKITQRIYSAPKRIMTKSAYLRMPDINKKRRDGVDYVATPIGPKKTQVYLPVIFESINEAPAQNIKDQYVGEARVRVEPNTYKKQIRNYHSVSMYRDHRKPYNYYLSIILAHNKTNKIDMIISTGTHILSKAGKWAQGFMKRRMNGTGKERFD